jgi:hypothetical protein
MQTIVWMKNETDDPFRKWNMKQHQGWGMSDLDHFKIGISKENLPAAVMKSATTTKHRD